MATKKITKTTLKSFIKKNMNKIMFCETSRFDGMQDMVDDVRNPKWVKPTLNTSESNKNRRLIFKECIWAHWNSIEPLENMNGYCVSNCCGSWSIAVF
jgi:hypothetical protein